MNWDGAETAGTCILRLLCAQFPAGRCPMVYCFTSYNILKYPTTKRVRRATNPFPQTLCVLGWQFDYTYKDFNGGR